MVGGTAARTGSLEKKEVSESQKDWDYRHPHLKALKSTEHSKNSEVYHYYPQPVWTPEIAVLFAEDQNQAPHLVFLEEDSGSYVHSVPYVWENNLCHSPVSNGVDLWCVSNHSSQIQQYSLLHPDRAPLRYSLPHNVQLAPNAASLWMDHPSGVPSEGLFCFLSQDAIHGLNREMNEQFTIPLEWNGVNPSQLRSLCGVWPWIFAVSERGDATLVKLDNTKGGQHIVTRSLLPRPGGVSGACLYSPPVFVQDKFFVEMLCVSENSSSGFVVGAKQYLITIPLSSSNNTSSSESIGGRGEAKLIKEQINVDPYEYPVSFRYPPIYTSLMGNASLLLYTGSGTNLLPLYDVNAARSRFLPLNRPISASRHCQALCGHELYVTQVDRGVERCSLLSGVIEAIPLPVPANHLKIVGTPVLKENRLLLTCTDRFLCLKLSQ